MYCIFFGITASPIFKHARHGFFSERSQGSIFRLRVDQGANLEAGSGRSLTWIIPLRSAEFSPVVWENPHRD
jgi:hypothetical protein